MGFKEAYVFLQAGLRTLNSRSNIWIAKENPSKSYLFCWTIQELVFIFHRLVLFILQIIQHNYNSSLLTYIPKRSQTYRNLKPKTLLIKIQYINPSNTFLFIMQNTQQRKIKSQTFTHFVKKRGYVNRKDRKQHLKETLERNVP